MRKGATTRSRISCTTTGIVALRNEKGSYNPQQNLMYDNWIVALRNEKGSYNDMILITQSPKIVALRNEKGSYN